MRQFEGRWKRWLPASKDARILDIGCGCGEFLLFLKSSNYTNLDGIDLNANQVAFAQAQGLPGVRLGDAIEYLRPKEEEYDLISAFNFLEHLKKEEVMDVLLLIRRALRPGGRLIAVTPNAISPFAGTTRYWDFSHELSYTPASFRQLAIISGFDQPIFEDYGPLPHSLVGLTRTLLWSAMKLALDVFSYIEVARPRDVSRVYTADMKIVFTRPAA